VFVVILAPYGLAGTLTGHTYKEGDLATQRILDEWRQFYIVKELDTKTGEKLPPAVEVVCGKQNNYCIQYCKFSSVF